MKFLQILFKSIILLTIGAGIYYGIEVLWRGYSHPTMLAAGAICFIAIGMLNDTIFEWDMSFTSQMFLSGVVVTAIELMFGLILNVWLGLRVWDYSDQYLNFMGQICIAYFGLWQLLSVIAIPLYDWTDYTLCKLLKLDAVRPLYKLI